MKEKDLVLIDRDILRNLVIKALKFDAIDQCSELLGEISFKEYDAILLDFAEASGVAMPDNCTGMEAISCLADWDIDFFHEVVDYDNKRKSN